MGAIMSIVSEFLYIGEKFALYLSLTCFLCCFVVTYVVTLGFGIGLGYNYCFVDMKTKFKYVEGRYVFPGKPPYDVEPEERLGGMPDADLDYGVRSEQDDLKQPVTRAGDKPLTGTFAYPGSPTQELGFNNSFMVVNTTAVADFSYLLSVNETESSIEANKKAATTNLLENTTQTNRRACTSLPIRTSPITSKSKPDTEHTYYIDEPTKGPSIDDEIDEPTQQPSIDDEIDEPTQQPLIDDEIDEPTQQPSIVNKPDESTQPPSIVHKPDEPTPEPSTVNELNEPTLESTIVFRANEPDPESLIGKDPNKRKMKKLVIPISGLDLISVLSKLRAENKNYSLHIITN